MKPNSLVLVGAAAFCLCILVTRASAGPLTFTKTSYDRDGSFGAGIALADVNGDGKTDLITANSSFNTLSVFTNDGSGAFYLNDSLQAGNQPGQVLAVDVNGDGKVDLVVQSQSDSTLTVLTNDGAGGFILSSTVSLTPGVTTVWVAASDVDGDGKLDLVTANLNNTLTVLTNDGSGCFGTNATLRSGNFPLPVIAADINGDGKPDLVCLNQNDSTVLIYTNRGGVFGSNSTINVGGAPSFVAAADVNGDGKVDLMIPDYLRNTVTIWTNNGGRLGSNNTYSVGMGPTDAEVADMNGDGSPDLLVSSDSYCPGSVTPCASGTVTILTNNGSGRFGSNTTLTAGIWTSQAVPVDVNGDGKMDVMVANIGSQYGPNTLTEFVNTSSFPPPKIGTIRSAGNLVITWPSSAVGFALQTNATLSSNTWINYSGPISDNGLNKSVTNNARSTAKLFFRLKK